MYWVNQKFGEAGTEEVNLNYKTDPATVGQWIREPIFLPLNEIPETLSCFSLKTWLELIRPKIKEGAQAYKDSKKAAELKTHFNRP